MFLDRFSKNTQTTNFIKICPVEGKLFQADDRTNRQRKLIVAFRNFAKAPKNKRQSLPYNPPSRHRGE
jgi:hypothetical protein